MLPVDFGRIERTDDGGVSWRTLWRGRDVVFTGIAVRGNTIVAWGYVGRRNLRRFEPVRERLLVVSANAGRRWRRLLLPHRVGALQILSSKAWIVVVPPKYDHGLPASDPRLLATDDAGASWTRRSLPAKPERLRFTIRFVTPRVGFTSARGKACQRRFQLWRTGNGGRSWSPVPRTCGLPLADLNVVTRRLLFAAHSETWPRVRSVVRRSADGGRTWEVLWRESHRAVERLSFVDARRGFVVDERHLRGDGGGSWCSRLRSTSDGGRTWSRRSIPISDFSCAGAIGTPPHVPTAFLGMRYAWAGGDAAGVVWRTSDGARTWRVSADPSTLGRLQLAPVSLSGYVDRIHRTPGGVTVETAAGPAFTADGGKTWTPAAWPSLRQVALAERRNAYVDWGPGEGFVVVTPDGGKTWRRLPLPRGLEPPFYPAEAAFSSAPVGMVVVDWLHYLTRDWGATWQRIRPPGFGAIGVRIGPGVAVVRRNKRRRPLVTFDAGGTWRAVGRSGDWCDGAWRPTRRDVWLTCWAGAYDDRTLVLLTSHDGGRTWLRRVGHFDVDHIVVTTPHEAWAFSSTESYVAGVRTKLWHTTNGGETWRRAWVKLSASAPVRYVSRH